MTQNEMKHQIQESQAYKGLLALLLHWNRLRTGTQGATFLFPCPLTSVLSFSKKFIAHNLNSFHFFFILPLEGR
jgi:hypothetical protein